MSSESWSERLVGGLRKTSERLAGNLAGFGGATRLSDTQLDDIEDALIMSDLGPRAAARIRKTLAAARFEQGLDDLTLRSAVAEEIATILRAWPSRSISWLSRARR
jgi:fused signal recognition particle receptor